MNVIKYMTLILVLCNVASIVQRGLENNALGSLLSYMTYLFLLLYYFLSKKSTPAWSFVLFAICFFTISSLNGVPSERDFYRDFIKYLIMIVCGGQLARDTTIKEVFTILLIGSSSILIHATVYADDYGRYSGFYLDPNSASFVCLMGCGLTYAIKNETWRLTSFFYLTFCGILTFSRTFLLLWFIINVIAVIQSKKNIKALSIGLGALILMLSVATVLQVNTSRLNMLEGIFENDVSNDVVLEDSRTETWSMFYDKIYEAPIFGNGYRALSGVRGVSIGVHNSYLRIIGEAGIIPLLLYLGIYFSLLYKCLKIFKTEVFKTLLVLSLMCLLLTIHNFIIDDYITFITLWVYFDLRKNKDKDYSNEDIAHVIPN